MNEPELFVEVRDKRADFRPGETINVTALWALSAPPRSLEARLCWFTRGKGTVDAGVVNTQLVPNPGLAGEHSFAFTLPDAPYSFSGKLISLIWAVELVAEPGPRSARCEFTLSPHGQEVVLTPLPYGARTR